MRLQFFDFFISISGVENYSQIMPKCSRGDGDESFGQRQQNKLSDDCFLFCDIYLKSLTLVKMSRIYVIRA